ncbi:MAG: MATE family efflux transporter [Rubrivivax sp.]
MSGTPAGAHASARTRALLEAPLLPQLLRLGGPNVLGLMAGTLTVLYDGWVVARLGADALAGVALVFPLVLLMVQMSGGGMGGATTAAVARALGAGDRARAGALVLNALWIGLAFALTYLLALVPFARAVFGALGGRGAVLDAAVSYAQVLFGGSLLVWCANLLSGALRGSGQTGLVSLLIVGAASVHLLLCPLLVAGAGRWPGLGVAGAACASLVTNGLIAGVLAIVLLRGRGPLALDLRQWRPRREALRTLLRVGLPAMLSPVLSNASMATATAWIATLGTAALAGFGLAARLEYVVLPIAFGFGNALTTMVATNLGAGRQDRARRVTWLGAALVLAITGTLGGVAALWPQQVLQPFTRDAQVLAFGHDYLQVLGGCYGLFGMGLALFFASQGAGRLFWPLVGSCTRLGVVALGGWAVMRLAPGHPAWLFAVVGAGFVSYAAVIAGAVALGATWRRD